MTIYEKIETPLDGAFIIEPQVFGDVRGWFYESYSKQKMHDIGIDVELSRTTALSRLSRARSEVCTARLHPWRRQSF